jgi:hypothetical protein
VNQQYFFPSVFTTSFYLGDPDVSPRGVLELAFKCHLVVARRRRKELKRDQKNKVQRIEKRSERIEKKRILNREKRSRRTTKERIYLEFV